MGQAARKFFGPVKREVQMYDIERRAEKVISKDKPAPAPMYPSTVKELERLKEENVSTEYLHKKDEQLDEYLKKVYVSSPDRAPPLERKINPNRPLPVNRAAYYGITYGYSESEEATVPEGKVSLKQALTFIANHQNDPKKYSSAAIASEYKISLADANDILEHFKMFVVRAPKKEKDPATMSTYERLQYRMEKMNIISGPRLIDDMNKLYEEEEKKKLQADENLAKVEETSGSDATKKKASGEIDLEIAKKSENGKISSKSEHDKKGSIKKRNQENG